jgi:hypothetical protein
MCPDRDSAVARGYQCVCGKRFPRWDKFRDHYKPRNCGQNAEHADPFFCHPCDTSFADYASFEKHYESKKKKVGRPKKLVAPA